ncbi:hypothetical protein [Vibrio parahaemolyticus]|uniref:hypothetical protein n=1 Tax=Vibrio parahaemolyticus TaxID=670 RepID=UPI0024912C92|nr:hypothetical protein [Vibrio parahaemolyticus]
MAKNPLIEALGMPLLPKQFIQTTTLSPDMLIDVSSLPTEHHGYYTRTFIDNLSECYVVQDEAPRLYDTVFRMIERGYIYRNPLVYGDIKQLQFADSIEIPEGQERTLKQTANQQSFLVAGRQQFLKSFHIKSTKDKGSSTNKLSGLRSISQQLAGSVHYSGGFLSPSIR